MAQQDDQYIGDFAIDDLRSRLLVLASRRDGSIRLTAYSLLNGDKQREAVLLATNGHEDERCLHLKKRTPWSCYRRNWSLGKQGRDL